MNHSWTDLPDSALKARLDISLREIVNRIKEQKTVEINKLADEIKTARESTEKQNRRSFFSFLFQLIIGAISGMDLSSTIHDSPDRTDFDALHNEMRERTTKAFSNSILFFNRLKNHVDLRPAVVRACYKQLHGFLYGRDRLDHMLMDLSKECGISSVEEDVRKLLSDLAEKDSLINPLKAAIKEQIKNAETQSEENDEK